MADSLSDILRDRGHNEPPEIARIKEYVQAEINQVPQISVTKSSYIVSISGSAAATTLRYKLFQLQRELGHHKKIVIRIR